MEEALRSTGCLALQVEGSRRTTGIGSESLVHSPPLLDPPLPGPLPGGRLSCEIRSQHVPQAYAGRHSISQWKSFSVSEFPELWSVFFSRIFSVSEFPELWNMFFGRIFSVSEFSELWNRMSGSLTESLLDLSCLQGNFVLSFSDRPLRWGGSSRRYGPSAGPGGRGGCDCRSGR